MGLIRECFFLIGLVLGEGAGTEAVSQIGKIRLAELHVGYGGV